MKQSFFIAIHKDNKVWKSSSSGGAFTALSDVWFSAHPNNAVVYGCALNEDLKAVHLRAKNREDRNKMRGSKYIQSDITGVFLAVLNDMTDGRFVLFSGTPCQISAIKNFLSFKKINTDNLLTVEVICHGVGSNHFFEDYINNLEKKYNSSAVSCNFRAKSRPGKLQDMEVIFANSRKYNAASTKYDWFYSAYLKSLILRPSCFKCPFATENRIADVTIADNWGGGESFKEPSKSLVIANSQLGLSLVECAFENMEYINTDFSKVHQPHMHSPCKKPDSYDKFWDLYESTDYLSVQKFIGNNTFKGKIKSFVAFIMYKLHLIELLKSVKERLR